MFKKLKEKITEEVKSSPQRFQQLTQSVSDKLQGTSTPDDNFFSIGEDDANTSTMSSDQGFSSVTLVSPSADNRSRRMSNSSFASDVSFLPRYEAGSLYHLQSDLDVSASEIEDNASQSSSSLGHLSKEQIYNAFQKSQMRYHKYRGRYTDLARHYKELERENAKMKSVLVETQDKAIRRVTELKEQCTLEQKAKAHLESALRDDLDEKQMKIQSLQTKVGLLQQGHTMGDGVEVDRERNKETTNHVDPDKLEQLTKYLNEARGEIEALNGRIQEYKATAIIFQSKEQEYKGKIAGLEKDIASFFEREKENNIKLAENKMDLHNELLSKDSEIARLKKDIDSLKTSLSAQEKDGKSVKIENLQSQNNKLIERVENLTQKCNGMENELLKMEKYKLEVKELSDKNLELSKSLDGSKRSQDKEQELLDENNQLQNVVDSLKVGLGSCRENLKRLTEEKNNLINTIEKEKQEYENQIETLRDSAKKGLFTLEKQISERLIRNYEEKEAILKKDFERRIEEISMNNNTLKEVHLQLLEKDNVIKKSSNELGEVREKLAQKENQYRELESNHLGLIEESSQLRGTVSNLERQFAEVGTENSKEYEEKIGRLQANIKTLHGEISDLKRLCHHRNDDNVQLNKDVLKVETENAELLQKVRLESEKEESIALETTESNLLELKVQALEEERKSLLDSFEMERKMFNKLLDEHKELMIKDVNVAELEDRNKKLEGKVVRFKGYLKEKEDSIVELSKIRLDLEQQLALQEESLRITEERQEAIEMDKTECNLLQIKVQQLENEKDNLNKSFERERRAYDHSFHKKTEETEIHREEIRNDNVSLAKEVLELKTDNEDLSGRVRLFEEQEEAVELETIECNILKLKVQELEKHKEELVFNFERERAMFNKILAEHEDLKLKEECIKDLESSNHHLTEKIAEYKGYLQNKEESIVELSKIKLNLEQDVAKLADSLRLKEQEIDAQQIEKTECQLLEMKVKTMEDEKQNLLISFELERTAFNDSYNTHSQLEHEIEKLTEEIQLLKREKDDLKRAFDTEKADLIDSFEREGKNFQLVNDKVKELDEENILLKEEKEKLNNKLKEESDRSGVEIGRLQDNVDKLQKECDNLKKVSAEREGMITELSQTVANFQREIDEKEEKLKTMTESLRKEKAGRKQAVQKLKDMAEELDIKNIEIREIRKSLETMEKLNSDVISRQSGNVQVLEEAKRKLYDMENDKQRLEKELKKKSDEYNFKAKEITVIEQQFNVLKQDKDGLSHENKQAKDRIEELSQECEQLRSLVPKVKEVDQLKMQNEIIQNQCDKLNQEISELKVRINQLSSDNRNINEEHERLITEVEGYKAKNEFLEIEKADFESIKAKLEEEKHSFEVSVTDLTEKLQQNYKDLEKASKLPISIPNELDLAQIQQDFLEIKGKCDTLYIENKNLKAEYTKLQEQCNNFSKVKKDLENQMVELERHYNEVLHEKQLLQDEVHELKISPINATSSTGNNAKLDNLTITKQEISLLGAVPNGPTAESDRLQTEIDALRDKVTQYKSLDITNKSSIEFYENELQKMKNQHEKLNRKLDETLVTLNHCTELSSSTEIEYLRNVLYNYMLGKESLVLARVITAVCKFDPDQTEAVLQKEQQKQTLLGHLGLL